MNSAIGYSEGAEVPEDKTKDNELIAQFMGGVFYGPDDLDHPNKWWFNNQPHEGYRSDAHHLTSGLRYHSDWSWLMPVVEKIETLYDTGIFYDGHRQPEVHNVRIYAKRGGSGTIVIFYGKSKIETTYNAVVEFIKWYNLESLKNKPI